MPQSALIGALLAGLLGGAHCMAMCTGWLAVVNHAPVPAATPLHPARVLAARELAAHAGRITLYALLGALAGAAGGAVLAVSLAPLQRVLYIAANVLLLVLAISIARGARAFGWLERAGLAVFARVAPAVRPLTGREGIAGRYALGLVWGLTPCVLVYSVLPVALLSGGAIEGALVMMAFGAGTLPNLLAAGWLLRRGAHRLPSPALRFAAAALVGAFALTGIARAIAFPESLGAGPYCVVP